MREAAGALARRPPRRPRAPAVLPLPPGDLDGERPRRSRADIGPAGV